MECRRVAVSILVLVAATFVQAAAPTYASARESDRKVAIVDVRWNGRAQAFEVLHRFTPGSGRAGEAAGRVLRVTVVAGLHHLGPIEVPVEPTRGSQVVSVPWGRDGGTMAGRLDVVATSELVKPNGKPLGGPVTFNDTLTVRPPVTSGDEKILGSMSTEAPSGNTGGATSFKGGPGCSIQCITSGVAYAVGVGANIRVTTDTAASIFIDITGVGTSWSGPDPTTAFDATFPDLQANTTYEVLAYAGDSDGYVSSAHGEITTLRRFASVEFIGFELTAYDSDLDDDFFFDFQVDGEWQPDLREFYHEPALPATLPGVREVTIEGAPAGLPVAVRVVQDGDEDQVCESWDWDGAIGGGEEECVAWGTGETGIGGVLLDTYPDDATSWTGHSLSYVAPTADWYPIQFSAPLDIEVWYA